MYNSQDIANRIKATAKSKSISLKTMLSDCGLGINLISHLSKGQAVTYVNLAKIADYLDCSVDYLLGRTDVVEVARSEEYITIPVAARGPVSENAVLTKEEKAAADAKHPDLA